MLNIIALTIVIFNCNGLNAKVIVDSQLWQANTHIYSIHTSSQNKIELYEFIPTADLQGLASPKAIIIQLPADLAAVQDVAVWSNERALLLVLTVSGQLLGIDIDTRRINFCVQLTDYLTGVDNSSSALFSLAHDNSGSLLVLVNTVKPGVFLFANSPQNLRPDNFATESQFIAAPPTVSQIVTAAQIFQRQDSKKIFTGVQTTDGYAIWELDAALIQQQQLHPLKQKTLQNFILLATKQPQELDAFVWYDKNNAEFTSYHSTETNLNVPTSFIQGENIQQFIVGPPLTTAFCSWYMVHKTSAGTYLCSNNFSKSIALPADAKIFLKHGELVFFSPAKAIAYRIYATTGRSGPVAMLGHSQYILPTADRVENADFLFWDRQNKQHVFFSTRGEKIYLSHVCLTFDKPKILSWRLRHG